MKYGFRKIYNRCKIERKKKYPSIFLEPNQKINGNNNDLILMNNYKNLQPYLYNYNIRMQNKVNDFTNNNITINSNIHNVNSNSNNMNFNFNNNII